MNNKKEKETLEELRQTLNKAKSLIDDLNDNGVKVRLRVGQGEIQYEKVFFHNKPKVKRGRAILFISEAIKHTDLNEEKL